MLTAGPTPLPPRVSQVMAEPILYHRAPAFVEIYARVLERLPLVFQTRNEVLSFAATGTGAMESAVANLVVAGEPAVVASCGKFGQRWAELCDAYGAETVHLEFEWGEKVDPARLDEALAGVGRPARAVFTTQSETSTGVVNDIRALNEVDEGARLGARRRRRVGSRRRRPAAGRVGGGRGRRGLAEVADVPARAGVRLGVRPGHGARRRESRQAATTSTGGARPRARRRTRPTRRSPRP